MNVSQIADEKKKLISNLVDATICRFNFNVTIPDTEIISMDTYVGPGYARPTPEMIEAVRLTGSREAILLDPVYTGKAMAGLIDLVRKGYFTSRENVLFLHTGGLPGLFAQPEIFLSGSKQS